MNDYLLKIKNELIIITESLILNNIIDSKFNKENISIDYLSKSKQGDISTNLYLLLKKNLILKDYDLYNHLYTTLLNFDFIKSIEISKKGFINIILNDFFILKYFKKIFDKPDNYGNNDFGENKKINIEFVSSNPTGPIHVAHMRGAVLGDVLSSIFESSGYDVTREFYVNDAGSQIEILGKSLFKRYCQLLGKKIEISENEYPGKYLIEIAKVIFQSDKDKWIKEGADKRDKYFKKFAVEYLMNSIKNDLKSININFDIFTYESSIVRKKLINNLFDILNKKGLLYEGYLERPKADENENWNSRKQLLFKSSNFYDDQDRPIKKENNEWTYFANDSAYHYDKFLRKYYKLINIWGADHIGYINRMRSLVEVISDNPNLLNIKVCQIVRLIKNNKIIKMSKREGNFITLNEILKIVGKDSLRYYMISSKSETPMDFDMDKVIQKNKDNPVFYCQYAYARASSVINKSKDYNKFKNFKNSLKNITNMNLSIYEKEIILKLIAWPHLLRSSSILMQPHKITNYLEDICSHFHSFWNMGKDNKNLRILDINEEEKTINKLIWIEAFRIVLKRAFKIIGINSPESM